jgi:CHAT domain-containing protein
MEAHDVPSVDEIVATFDADDIEARKALIERCPPGGFRDMALMAAQFTNEGGNMQALQFMISAYQFAGPQEYGVAFGEACYRLGRRNYAGPQSNSLFLLGAGNGSIGWMTSLSNLGRHQEARDRGTDVLAWLEDYGDTTNADGIRLRLVEASFGLQDYDEAERMLDSMDASQLPWAVQINYRTCRDRLERFKQRGTTVSEERTDDPRSRLRGIFGLVPPTSPDAKNGSDIEYVKTLDPISDEIMRVLGTSADSEAGVMNRIVKATALFRDPVAGRDATRISPVEKELRAARAWMQQHDNRDGENDACWGLYLCYTRTGRNADAVEALQALRRNIERARAGIADPIERAGVTARYPLLYPCLVGLLYQLQDRRGLLEAIEASKGRALADVMALGGETVDDRTFADSAGQLSEVLAGAGKSPSHYITYLVDDDCVYAALVSSEGPDIETARITLSRADLATLADEIREAAASRNPADRMPKNLGDRLAPLVAMLDGVPVAGDHLCYSPDDVLHLLPLQAAELAGRAIVRDVSVSRTHGAHVLRQQLARKPRKYPRGFVIEVPSQADAAAAERLDVFALAGKALREGVGDTTTIPGKAADLRALKEADLTNAVVHFATHGVFPPAGATGAAANPYTASGLLLASGDKLPDLRAVDGKAGDHLLSPARLVRENVRFDGAHVTLQACVSGLAREGVGGDALGLEWALFQLGASSILSTHWNVSAQTSGAFAARFYARMLNERKSRAAAWRSSVLEFLGRSDALARPYHWSAFSLSGDWR